jgi:hypothetical protein
MPKCMPPTGRPGKHISTITPSADAATVQNVLHRSNRDHSRELEGVLAAPQETEVALEGASHGFGNRLFAIDPRKVPKDHLCVALDDGLEAQETVINGRRLSQAHGTVSKRGPSLRRNGPV